MPASVVDGVNSWSRSLCVREPEWRQQIILYYSQEDVEDGTYHLNNGEEGAHACMCGAGDGNDACVGLCYPGVVFMSRCWFS